jgi:hypothetical protein
MAPVVELIAVVVEFIAMDFGFLDRVGGLMRALLKLVSA